MRKALLFTLLAGLLPLIGQQQAPTYLATQKTSLTGAAEVVTVQLPATAPVALKILGLSVYCSAQCDWTMERDGSLATTTTITPVSLNNSGPGGSNSATAFRSSNVGSGTTIGTYTVPATGTLSVDMTGKNIYPGENLTVRTASVTATVEIMIKWQEVHP